MRALAQCPMRRWRWERSVDRVLMNTAIAEAKDPIKMARAMKLAVEAGRLSYLAERTPKRIPRVCSSMGGLI